MKTGAKTAPTLGPPAATGAIAHQVAGEILRGAFASVPRRWEDGAKRNCGFNHRHGFNDQQQDYIIFVVKYGYMMGLYIDITYLVGG